MTDHPAIICGARQPSADGRGTEECVEHPDHTDRAHYWIRLVSTVREAS